MAKKRKKTMPLGCVVVDFEALTAVCAERGEWIDAVLNKTSLSHHTVERMRKGLPIRPSSLRKLAGFLGPQNMGRFSRRIGSGAAKEAVAIGRELAGKSVEEWQVEQTLTPWITASNGLQYQVVKLRHLHVPETWARGKCYDLSFLSDDARSRLREHLVRHPMICRRFPKNPRIPINERTFPDPTGHHWWVIDSWIEGVCLADLLGKAALPLADALRIGREIAEGLKLLHDHGIIRRELSPKFVLLGGPDGSVVLTDFELAKLLGDRPTVSEDWPDDPYRAPEVGDGEVDARADVYSWGRIILFAALGNLPAVGKEKAPLHGSDLPEPLIELLVRSIALPRSDRPSTMDDVLSILDSLR